MAALYPLKFKAIYKEKVWGGTKLRTVLGKDFGDLPNCGESWEISGVPGDISIVAEGSLKGENLNDLIIKYQHLLIGNSVYKRFGDFFPLLIKFIDANDDLSIQVHPNDELANKRHKAMGKTEMWFIIQADSGARLISGFNRALDKQTYLEYFNSGKLESVLNQEDVFKDDLFFLPAGRVHTIGKGVLLAEIQQSSDITYRIYDFDRKDSRGNLRELHVEEALDALDFQHYQDYKTSYNKKLNQPTKLLECDYFKTSLLDCDSTYKMDLAELDSFVILICLEGSLSVNYGESDTIELQIGETILIPACLNELVLHPNESFKILETHVPVF